MKLRAIIVDDERIARHRLRRLLGKEGDVEIVAECAAGNYAILHASQRNHMLRETMSHLEAQLPPTFLRVSRSAIVNLRRVKELHTAANGEHSAQLTDGQRIPLTRSLREVEARLRVL